MADDSVLPGAPRRRRRTRSGIRATNENTPLPPGTPPEIPSIRELTRHAQNLFDSIDQNIAVAKATIIALGKAEVVIQRMRDMASIACGAANDDERQTLAQEYEKLRHELETIAASQGIGAAVDVPGGIPRVAETHAAQIDTTLEHLDQRLSAIQCAAEPLINQFLLLQIRRAIAVAEMESRRPVRPA